MKHKTTFAKLALLLATIIWGSSFAIMKNSVEVIPPNTLLAIRFSAACIILSLIFFKRLLKINKEYMWQSAIIGLCLFLAYCVQTFGLAQTTPGKNAFLTAVYCVIVPFLFWFVTKEKPGFYNVIAAIICIVGIGFVSLDGNLTMGIGDALTLVGGFFYALHIVVVAKFGKEKDPIVITILQFFYCACFSIIASLLFEKPHFSFTPQLSFGLAYLAVFCTATALLLQNVGQKHTNPSVSALILSLESVFGVIFSIILYGDKMTLKLIIGFILIFSSIIISETKFSFLKGKK